MTNYNFQITAADEIFKMALSEQYLASILAACPSSGKSTIIIRVLNKFFELNPDFKVVIFAHNLNNLRDQMLDSLNEGHITPEFTFGKFGQDVQVQVGVVAGGSAIRGNVDIVVFDECHQFYLEDMANDIIRLHNPKYVIGMTGTPSYFNGFNKNITNNSKFNVHKKFGVHYISAEELVDFGVFSNVLVDVVNGEELEDRLNNSLKRAVSHGMDLSKIIVATKDQMEANMIGYLLTKQGRKVGVSTSSTDPKNTILNAYKNDEYDTLVIVLKGVLGFSDNNTTGLIDLRASQDVDCRYQIFARVLRKHPKNVKKFYISAVKQKTHNKEVTLLQTVMGLMQRKNFVSYTKA
jgi:superfamily II DNA or RNA helicase